MGSKLPLQVVFKRFPMPGMEIVLNNIQSKMIVKKCNHEKTKNIFNNIHT